MAIEVKELKEKVKTEIDEVAEEVKETAKKIFENPEQKFEEYKAMEWLTEQLEENGFEVERGISDMDTAFRAVCPNKSEGPKIAFLCEYDALPNLGHGCGHNLIAGTGLAAGLGLCKAMEDLPGEVQVIGTPAEEGGGGKIEMVNDGVFDDIDAAMMVHPSDKTIVGRGSLAIRELKMDFYGESSHASAEPEKGINALDAAILTFNNINAFREHMEEKARVHGIITDGGDKPNIVPSHAGALFYVRAPEKDYMEELLERVKDCARAGAQATGAEVELNVQGLEYEPMRPNPVLVNLYEENAQELGEELEEYEGGMGSTDMGNVSQTVPAIHGYIRITEGETPGHSEAFVEASNSDRGYEAMVTAGKILAMTGLDILTDEDKLQKMKKTFEENK